MPIIYIAVCQRLCILPATSTSFYFARKYKKFSAISQHTRARSGKVFPSSLTACQIWSFKQSTVSIVIFELSQEAVLLNSISMLVFRAFFGAFTRRKQFIARENKIRRKRKSGAIKIRFVTSVTGGKFARKSWRWRENLFENWMQQTAFSPPCCSRSWLFGCCFFWGWFLLLFFLLTSSACQLKAVFCKICILACNGNQEAQCICWAFWRNFRAFRRLEGKFFLLFLYLLLFWIRLILDQLWMLVMVEIMIFVFMLKYWLNCFYIVLKAWICRIAFWKYNKSMIIC